MVFPVKMFVLVHFTAKSFGKVELNGRILDLTIDVVHFESVEVSGQCQRFIFKAFKQEKLPPRWFFVRNKGQSAVKVSLVDGLQVFIEA